MRENVLWSHSKHRMVLRYSYIYFFHLLRYVCVYCLMLLVATDSVGLWIPETLWVYESHYLLLIRLTFLNVFNLIAASWSKLDFFQYLTVWLYKSSLTIDVWLQHTIETFFFFWPADLFYKYVNRLSSDFWFLFVQLPWMWFMSLLHLLLTYLHEFKNVLYVLHELWCHCMI